MNKSKATFNISDDKRQLLFTAVLTNASSSKNFGKLVGNTSSKFCFIQNAGVMLTFSVIVVPTTDVS